MYGLVFHSCLSFHSCFVLWLSSQRILLIFCDVNFSLSIFWEWNCAKMLTCIISPFNLIGSHFDGFAVWWICILWLLNWKLQSKKLDHLKHRLFKLEETFGLYCCSNVIFHILIPFFNDFSPPSLFYSLNFLAFWSHPYIWIFLVAPSFESQL